MNYQNTKIYKIESTQGDKIYIGSTTKQYLSQRMDGHRRDYKKWLKGEGSKIRSIELFEEYGLGTCSITLLETFPCNSKDEAHGREAYYIRSMECVNKVIPNRTRKEYMQDNKEIIKEYKKEYSKQYRFDNKEEVAKSKKDYYIANKEAIDKKTSEYCKNNKDKIKEQKQKAYTCACGKSGINFHKAQHEKCKTHQAYLLTISNQ